MKILLDISTLGHKGLGRFTKTLLDCLKELPVDLKTYKNEGEIYQISSYFKFLNKNDWDIFIAPHFIFPINILFSRRPIFITIHDLIPFKKFNYKFSLLFIFLLVVTKFNNVKVLTPSESSRKGISDLFYINEKKIYIINNQAQNFGKINKGKKISKTIKKEDSIQILYIGNLKRHKNVQLILKACEIVNSYREKNIKLSIVAGFNTKTNFQENLSLNRKYIKVYKQITDILLSELIQDCNYLIQPSFEEGFGIPILEALMKDKNVICSDIEVFHELYEGQTIYINQYDPFILAEILRQSYEIINEIPSSVIMGKKFNIDKIKLQLKKALDL